MWAVCSDRLGNVAIISVRDMSTREVTDKAITIAGMVEPVIVTHFETLSEADNHAIRIGA